MKPSIWGLSWDHQVLKYLAHWDCFVVEWINHVLYLTCCWDAAVLLELSSTGGSQHVCLSWVPEGKVVLGISVMKWGSVYQNWALLLVFAYVMVTVLEMRCGETWRSRPHVLSWARGYSLNKLSMNQRRSVFGRLSTRMKCHQYSSGTYSCWVLLCCRHGNLYRQTWVARRPMGDLYREMEEERVIGRKRRSVIRQGGKDSPPEGHPMYSRKAVQSCTHLDSIFLEAGLWRRVFAASYPFLQRTLRLSERGNRQFMNTSHVVFLV